MIYDGKLATQSKSFPAMTIDITNVAELHYVATKFSCTPGDVVVAIVSLKTAERETIYKWLSENILTGQ